MGRVGPDSEKAFQTDLIYVTNCDCREVDLIQGLGSGVDGGHHRAAVEVRSSCEDEEGCNHDGCTHYQHPDVPPGRISSKNIPKHIS